MWGTKRAMGRISGTGGRARAVPGSAVAFLLGLSAACGSEPEEPQWGEGGTLVENFLASRSVCTLVKNFLASQSAHLFDRFEKHNVSIGQ